MIKTYMKGPKKLYEVYVAERNQNKRIISKRKRGVASEREAKEIEFQFKALLRSPAHQRPLWNWANWHQEFLRRARLNYRIATLKNYDGHLRKWIPESWSAKLIDQITTDEVHEVIQCSSVRLGSVSQKNLLKMLKRVFQAALDDGLIGKNPVQGITIKVGQSIQKVLTAREIDILLREARDANHRFYPVWAFALKTGMRSGEMYALKWTDGDLDAEIIAVNKQWTSKDGLHELKTGDWRVAPICTDLKEMLLEMKLQKKDQCEYVLPRLMDWTHGEQAKILREFCNLIGITSVKFHDLRASFITNMLAQGVPLVKVMAIVGHKRMETTDIYLRLAGVDVKGATESLGYAIPRNIDKSNVFTVNFGKKK